MNTNIQFNRVIVVFRQYFNLKEDKENDSDISYSIRKGAEFKGTSLWILVFAILLAFIGLNVNSTDVDYKKWPSKV